MQCSPMVSTSDKRYNERSFTPMSGALSAGGKSVFQYDVEAACEKQARRSRAPNCKPKLWCMLLGSFLFTMTAVAIGSLSLWRKNNIEAVNALVEMNTQSLKNSSASWDYAIRSLTKELHNHVGIIEKTVLKEVLEAPRQVVELNALAVAHCLLSVRNMDSTLEYMWHQLHDYFPSVEGISVSDSLGMYAEFERSGDHGWRDEPTNIDAEYTLEFRARNYYNSGVVCLNMCPPLNDSGTGLKYMYAMNGSTGRRGRYIDSSAYPFLNKTWFRRAVESLGSTVWITSTLFDPQDKFDFRIVRAVNVSDQVQVVVGCDITLDYLSRYLATQELANTGRIFVVNRKGRMVASSGGMHQVVCRSAGGEPEQCKWNEIGDYLINSSVHSLIDRFGSLEGVYDNATVSLDEEAGVLYSSFVIRNGGGEFDPEWIIVNVQPIDTYLGAVDNESARRERAIAIDRIQLHNKIYRREHETLILCLLFGLFGAAAMAMIARTVSKPLNTISHDMRTVANFEVDTIDRVLGTPSDRSHGRSSMDAFGVGVVQEIADMRESFVYMANGLRSFARYMDPSVVQILVQSGQQARLRVAKADVTVFFSDIAGFTSIAEQLDPDTFMEVIGGYLDEMSSVIMSHKGIVGEFIGDAIMAWWNAPMEIGETHTALALRAALEQQRALAKLRNIWCQRGLPEVKARMGLVRGTVLAGNIGSEKRMKYGLVGDCVNLASRLESLCKHYGVDILIDDEAAAALGVEDGFLLRLLDRVAVKGREQKTTIYELVGQSADIQGTAQEVGLRAFCEDFSSIHALYQAGEFFKAAQELELYRHRWPTDIPARLLQERVHGLMTSPPGADWSPTERLGHK